MIITTTVQYLMVPAFPDQVHTPRGLHMQILVEGTVFVPVLSKLALFAVCFIISIYSELIPNCASGKE